MRKRLNDIQNKINNLKVLKEEISQGLEEMSIHLNNQVHSFNKIKEIEVTINNLNNLNIQVPDELVQLKNDLQNALSSTEKLTDLKKQFAELVEYQIKNQSPQRKKMTSKQYNYPSTSYANKTLLSVKIGNEDLAVSKWKDLVKKVLELLYNKHPDQFDLIYNVSGKKRPLFSTTPAEMRIPCYINSLKLYYETNLSANQCVSISKKLLELFGYNEEDLILYFEN
ncbi:MAG: hypothetical protein KA886_09115 [Candidatus Cloacimonetes bacterium]|nr:hypothetical protein [Candidatus Cloacimonadota bacterium]